VRDKIKKLTLSRIFYPFVRGEPRRTMQKKNRVSRKKNFFLAVSWLLAWFDGAHHERREKNRQCARPGSAILIVLLVMSAIIFCGFNLFKSTILTTELVLLRQEREQHMRVAEGVLNYGINLCTNRFASFVRQAKAEKTEKWDFAVGRWKLRDAIVLNGNLQIILKGETAKLSTSICFEGAFVFGMECDVERKKDKKKNKYFYVVRNWATRTV